MAQVTYAVEIGAWVESDTPKKNGAGMRKVWVAGDAGAESRLSVIARTDGKADRHLVTLPVGDADARDIARNVLTLAGGFLNAYEEALSKPTPKPSPKAPTPPPAPKAPEAVAANRAIAIANARGTKPAPTPRVAAPAPKPTPAPSAGVYSPQDWASLIG